MGFVVYSHSEFCLIRAQHRTCKDLPNLGIIWLIGLTQYWLKGKNTRYGSKPEAVPQSPIGKSYSSVEVVYSGSSDATIGGAKHLASSRNLGAISDTQQSGTDFY